MAHFPSLGIFLEREFSVQQETRSSGKLALPNKRLAASLGERGENALVKARG
jgi:hypothetical protein